MKNVELLKILGNIYATIDDEYLKGLLVRLFNAIENSDLENLDLDVLNLFDYKYIKYEYHAIKDSIDLIFEYHAANKYDVINTIRVNNGLGYDRSYLDYLLNSLDATKFNTFNLDGLFNLLSDNNLIYNSVGLRIIILRHLLNIKISDLKFIDLENNRLGDNYKHLVFKNGKIKNYTKLYFIDGDIILSTLLHDGIKNVLVTTNDNINYCYGGNNDLNNGTDFNLDLKERQYRYFDKEENYINNIRIILNGLKKQYNYLRTKNINLDNKFSKYENIINSDIINNENYYLDVIFSNENIIYPNDYLYGKLIDIENYLSDLDDFKSNDLDEHSFINDYLNFKYSNKENNLFNDITITYNKKTNTNYKAFYAKNVLNGYFKKQNNINRYNVKITKLMYCYIKDI